MEVVWHDNSWVSISNIDNLKDKLIKVKLMISIN